VKYTHLKDLTPGPFSFRPLGEGTIDLIGVVAALRAAGYDGWLTVELDEYHGARVDVARRSREYLAAPRAP
jgi:inosose dehydratase